MGIEASIYNDQGIQNLVVETFEAVLKIDDRIFTRYIPQSEILVTSFSKSTVIRQIMPGQYTLADPVVAPVNKAIGLNLDLSAGNSESIIDETVIRVRMALTNLEYTKATFIAYNKPIYQGKGIYCIQWGLMVEI